MSNFFQPTFGNRPEQIVGRDGEINAFISGLKEPIRARERCTLFLGQRGMGKTALLLEIADRAAAAGFIVARVTAFEGMPSAIIEQIQLNGSRYFKDEKKSLSGVTVGAMGFSFGLAFSEAANQQYGFRAKMSLLCERLEEKKKGVLILIDEVQTSAAMREVATAYQELVGDHRNIAIGMAGLPYAVSGVLNDEVLTFLNRACKVNLGSISIASIRAYFEHAFRSMNISCPEPILDLAAEKSRGLPYFMQLLGYYLTLYAKDTSAIDKETLKKAESSAIRDLEDNVFKPTLAPLSDNDRFFLMAMARCKDPITTHELQEQLGSQASSLQHYRKRLLETGIIEAPRRGELVFAVPYLREYLLDEEESGFHVRR